jgi:hypothetical protein
MVQITQRDELMIDWLAIVRVADYDAIRWALPAFSGDPFPAQPVHRRIAQNWVWRMRQIGYVDHTRPTHSTGTIIWPTHLAVGRAKPNLFRQTTRHEVLVARASALYLANGYSWARDRRPRSHHDHQADGVATRDGYQELIEIELTPKTLSRYTLILNNHAARLEHDFTRVVYFCTPAAAATTTREANRILFRDTRGRLEIIQAINADGKWQDDEVTLTPASQPASERSQG